MTSTGRSDPQSFMQRLHAPAPIGLIWLSLGSTAMAEIAAQAGPGAVVIDRQHGLWNRDTLEAAVGVMRYQVPVVIRCAENAAVSIAEALDCGAASVLVPLVESADDAARAVRYGRYPPLGERSAGGVRPLLRGADKLLDANRELAIGVMIETVAGVENADAIAATPGLDYIFIGTGDLAMSRGAAEVHRVTDDCRRVREAAARHGVPCGIFTSVAADAVVQVKAGFTIVVLANDIELAMSGFNGAVRALSA